MKKTAFIVLAASLFAASCAHKAVVKETPAAAPKPAVSQAPVLELDKVEHNFGPINEGENPSVSFIVTNRGKEPLIIADVSRPCGCTTPVYSTNAIPYGKSDTIKVSYNSEGRPGYFIKTMTVKSNDPAKPTVEISILGEVKERPRAYPVELPKPMEEKPKE